MSLKDKTLCVVCRTYVDAGKGMRTECGHWTHTECLRSLGSEVPKSYDECPQCLGFVDPTAVVLPENEPVTDDGVDYVMNPPTKSSLSMLRGAASQVLSVLTRNKRVDTANPFSLLAQGPYHMPVDCIIRDHNVGLQHMIKAGVTIDDFLSNGYALKDILLFKDIGGRGEKRAQQALYALKMTADHLRDYGKSLLPVKELREKLGVTPRVICSMYGLQCPPGGYVLSTPASEDWSARDILDLGFNMDDLLDHAKMEYQEQYFALDPTTEDEIDLQVTPEHASRLRSLEAEQEELMIQQQMEEARRNPPVQQTQELIPTPAYMVERVPRTHGGGVSLRNVYIPDAVPYDVDDDDEAYYKRRTRHGLKPK